MRTARLVLSVLPVLLLGACATSQPTSSQPGPPPDTTTSPDATNSASEAEPGSEIPSVIVPNYDGLDYAVSTARRGDPGAAALITGQIVDANGCLALRVSDDGPLVVPVFPADTELAPGVYAGQTTGFGGAMIQNADYVANDATIPASCPADAEFWAVNEDGTVISDARITALDGNTVTAEPVPTAPLSRGCSLFTFNRAELPDREVAVGDLIQIHYDRVMESYPCQVPVLAWTNNQDSPRLWIDDFELYTHCGIRALAFDDAAPQTGLDFSGRQPHYYFRVGGPLDDGNSNPPDGWGNPYQTGRLSVTGNTAVFTDDAGHREVFEFQPNQTPPLCD